MQEAVRIAGYMMVLGVRRGRRRRRRSVDARGSSKPDCPLLICIHPGFLTNLFYFQTYKILIYALEVCISYACMSIQESSTHKTI